MNFIKDKNTVHDENLLNKLESIRQSDYKLKKATIYIWFVLSLSNAIFLNALDFPIFADWIIISTPIMNFTIGLLIKLDGDANKYRKIMEVFIPYYILIVLLEHMHFIDIKGFDNPEVWVIAMMALYLQVIIYSVIY